MSAGFHQRKDEPGDRRSPVALTEDRGSMVSTGGGQGAEPRCLEPKAREERGEM